MRKNSGNVYICTKLVRGCLIQTRLRNTCDNVKIRVLSGFSKSDEIMTNGWLVVGIAGATCSGKTTLAKRLHENLKNSVLINQDEYFLPVDDPRHTLVPELNHFNWELLTAMDMPKMINDVKKLLSSPAKNEDIDNNRSELRVLILDGFLLFNSKELADLCDLRYFLDMTKEQCWERRKVRVYDPPDPPNYFQKVVWPEYVRTRSKILLNKALSQTITSIDGSQSTEDTFSKVFNEIKLRPTA